MMLAGLDHGKPARGCVSQQTLRWTLWRWKGALPDARCAGHEGAPFSAQALGSFSQWPQLKWAETPFKNMLALLQPYQ